MVNEPMETDQLDYRDFFISYTGTDQQWAEWIAMQLEQAGYTLFIQAWDFQSGSNFLIKMDQAAKCAERTLIVLSPSYLESDYCYVEWAAALRTDPLGKNRRLLPVRIQPCKVEGLLGSLAYIDLVSLNEEQAQARLLAGIRQERAKPSTVVFPGSNKLQEIRESSTFPGPFPAIWNIPYQRNPVFTGREDLLAQLVAVLKPGKTIALAQSAAQAISGLGGIGKTQVAIEYAYRHCQDYQAVLWARAETYEELISSYVAIAHYLNLPQKNEQDQSLVAKAVLQWLKTQTQWLLILDNADDLAMVREFLPVTFSGHIILTTQAQSTGQLAQRLVVETMSQEMGALLLLRRAMMIAADAPLETASSSDIALAKEISKELGGLPLALDQAGAYIEETPCSLQEYQQLYRIRRIELLNIRGGLLNDHPNAVATTVSLSFQRVEERNPAAADLLRLCACLAPDPIPETVFTRGMKLLEARLHPTATNPIKLNQALRDLGAYSLIHRNVIEKTLTVHRLIQMVLWESMSLEVATYWKQQAMLAIYESCPPDILGIRQRHASEQ